ncbi:hypothetical protein ACR6C2_36405 [Streptomyces sp. INA 01156]
MRHLSPPEGDRVVRLADPRPCGAPSGSQQWWPPVMLSPDWVDEHAVTFDVFHLHFGFDAQSPSVLREPVEALRRNGKPFVYTAHDLASPHHHDEGEHRAQMDVLVPRRTGSSPSPRERRKRSLHAGATPRWSCRTRTWSNRQASYDPARTGQVHGRRARQKHPPDMDPLPVTRVLADALSELPDAMLRIDCHPEIDDPASHWYAPECSTNCASWTVRGGWS